MKSYKFITVIPARGGSKRFPGKNIYPFIGKPLIAHSIDYSNKCPYVCSTFVTTDSNDIKEIATQYGAKIINRPIELGGDLISSAEVLKDSVIQLMDKGFIFDYIILLQPTNPLRPKDLIEKAIDLIEANNYKSLFSVSRSHKKLGKIVDNSFVPWNYHFGQRSQDMEPLFYENGLLYITHKDLILQGCIMNENSFPLIIDHIFGEVDIDTPEDMTYGEYIYNHYNFD